MPVVKDDGHGTQIGKPFASRLTPRQPGWSRPEQPPIASRSASSCRPRRAASPFLPRLLYSLNRFGGCSAGEPSRPVGRLGLEMPCLQPAIVAVADESTLCALQSSRRHSDSGCSGWCCATCIACEVPGVPAGGSRNCGSSSTSTDSCCCCCSCTNLLTRCMTGKYLCFILLHGV